MGSTGLRCGVAGLLYEDDEDRTRAARRPRRGDDQRQRIARQLIGHHDEDARKG